MENMSLEEKVNYLEERVKKLEKIENNRRTWKWIKFGLIVAFYVGIIVLMYIGYRYIKTNYLDPYDNLKSNLKTNIESLKDLGSFFGY